jgi:subtilisin family serine protease
VGLGREAPRGWSGFDPQRRRDTLRRLLAKRPRPAGQPREQAGETPGAAAKADGAEAGSRRQKAARGPQRGRPIAGLLPPIGSFRQNEVLAIDLGSESLAKVRAGNYRVLDRIELPELGMSVTRLAPPEGIGTVAGWERLNELLPDGGFALNRIYTPYRLGGGPGRSGTAVGAAAGKGCAEQRCFGAALINWQAQLGVCARNVKVGVVDTGFDIAHPAFAGLGYDYREFLPEGKARASAEHGTGILALLAGHAESGTPGLIPEAHFVLANVFYADGDGQPVTDSVRLLQALHWLKRNGVAVANLSFAGPPDEVVHRGLKELTKAGIVVVAAAGNEGPAAPPSYPAAYDEVIAVTAVDRNLTAYRYASRGDHIDVAAPGVDVWTALPGRREGPQTGTSFAVPYVTAVVTVAQAGEAVRPAGDARAAKARALAQLRRYVKSLGGRDRDPIFGAGLIQAPAPCDAAAPTIVAAARSWAGTVRREAGPPAAEPSVIGAWVSTVRAAFGEGALR